MRYRPNIRFSPRGGYYIAAAVLFAVWWFFSNRLRYWSLRQDETGSVDCTKQDALLRVLQAWCSSR